MGWDTNTVRFVAADHYGTTSSGMKMNMAAVDVGTQFSESFSYYRRQDGVSAFGRASCFLMGHSTQYVGGASSEDGTDFRPSIQLITTVSAGTVARRY